MQEKLKCKKKKNTNANFCFEIKTVNKHYSKHNYSHYQKLLLYKTYHFSLSFFKYHDNEWKYYLLFSLIFESNNFAALRIYLLHSFLVQRSLLFIQYILFEWKCQKGMELC